MEKYLEYLWLRKQQKARTEFWFYCRTAAPDFYADDRWHLQQLCDTLQAFWEGRLLRPDDTPFRILIIEMPPRHGKTRTLILFCAWVLGLAPDLKVLTAAYAEDLATDFSRGVRDIIGEDRNSPEQVVFSDIFPRTRLKYGDASFRKWALAGQYFTFKSTGKGGGVTGKGGKLLLIDDPIKSAEEAFNATQLEKDWLWYTSTWLSRKEAGALEIINHTPWAKDDIGGRLQRDFPGDCQVLKLPALDEKAGTMLCPSILSLAEYRAKERIMEPVIFEANYKLIRVDVKGLLYGSEWTTYTELPRDADGHDLAVERILVCDTADTGDNFLCAIWARPCRGFAYVTDVYYTQASVETTEPELCDRILRDRTHLARIESNAGGHAIAVHIEQAVRARGWSGTSFETPTQSKNKIARILANAKAVKTRVVFPVDWAVRWPAFHAALCSYQKAGKNKVDDAPDTITALVEFMAEREGTRIEINRPIA
jgi:predicted phage terminase large subunit-like protein